MYQPEPHLIPLVHVDTVESLASVIFKFQVGRPCRVKGLSDKPQAIELAPGVIAVAFESQSLGPVYKAVSVAKRGAETHLVGLGSFYIQSPILGSSYKSFHQFWEAASACKTSTGDPSPTNSSPMNPTAPNKNLFTPSSSKLS